MGYARSPFRDFETCLKIMVGLDEDDIQLILEQYNANFVTHELDAGIYTIEDLQKAVYSFGDHEGTLQIEHDDSNKKTKLILSHFGSTSGIIKFDEKSFFGTLLGFTPYWDNKPTNAIHFDEYGVYISDKILNSNTLKKIHLKSDVIDGSIQDGTRQPILFSFILDIASGYKVFLRARNNSLQKNK